MPGVNPSSDGYLLSQIQQLQQQIQALQTQQQYVIVDGSLRLRVQLGLLQSGDYGILLEDTLGNKQEMLPRVRQFVFTLQTTTSSTYVTLPGSSAITAVIGASGDCEITLASNIGINNVNDTGSMGVLVDGATVFPMLACSGSASLIEASCCLIASYTSMNGGPGLTPGSHTFQMAVKGSTSGHTFNFTSSALIVQPI